MARAVVAAAGAGTHAGRLHVCCRGGCSAGYTQRKRDGAHVEPAPPSSQSSSAARVASPPSHVLEHIVIMGLMGRRLGCRRAAAAPPSATGGGGARSCEGWDRNGGGTGESAKKDTAGTRGGGGGVGNSCGGGGGGVQRLHESAQRDAIIAPACGACGGESALEPVRACVRGRISGGAAPATAVQGRRHLERQAAGTAHTHRGEATTASPTL